MEWTAEEMNRLYGLYQRYMHDLRKDVIKANRLLGSPTPERTKLKDLSREEFEALLEPPTDEVTRDWVLGIIRGHEHEFSQFAVGKGARAKRRPAGNPKASSPRQRHTAS